MSTPEDETVGTAWSILLEVKLGEEGSRVTDTHYFPKFCISKENSREKTIYRFLSKKDFMVSGYRVHRM